MSAPVTRLPTFFPLVPRECKAAAAPFFECFSAESDFDGSSERANAGRSALAQCGDQRLRDYVACAEKHLTEKQLAVWRAPQSYLKIAEEQNNGGKH